MTSDPPRDEAGRVKVELFIGKQHFTFMEEIVKIRTTMLITLFFVLALSLTACGDEVPVPTPVVGTPAPTMTLGPQSYVGKLTYKSVRPSQGTIREMKISESGEVTLLREGATLKTAQLTPEQLADLRTMLETSQFFGMDPYYGRGRIPDDVLNTITLEAGDRKKAVTLEELDANAGGISSRVRDFFVFVGRIYSSESSQLTPTP